MNKSIQRAIAILDCLVKSPRPLGISELARQLDIPKSSASDCLYTLHSCGCVVMNADLEPRNLKLFAGEVSEAAAQMARLIA